MRLIDSNVELLQQGDGINGVLKQIEIAGRTCYKSENKITENSFVDFVKKMIASGHYAMLEHGTMYFDFDITPSKENKPTSLEEKMEQFNLIQIFSNDKYSVVNAKDSHYYITTNYRVFETKIVNKDFALKYLCSPTENHSQRISLRITCDRGVSHELVRHRVFSFAQESTRRMTMAA